MCIFLFCLLKCCWYTPLRLPHLNTVEVGWHTCLLPSELNNIIMAMWPLQTLLLKTFSTFQLLTFMGTVLNVEQFLKNWLLWATDLIVLSNQDVVSAQFTALFLPSCHSHSLCLVCIFLLDKYATHKPQSWNEILSSVQMGYMVVEEQSSTLLHLKRSPGLRSWSLLVGRPTAVLSIHSNSLAPLSPKSQASYFNCRYIVCWVGSCVLQLRCANWIKIMYRSVDSFWTTLFTRSSSHFFFCGSHRQRPLEAFLRDGLSICSRAEHGGMAGGRVWQDQEPDWA